MARMTVPFGGREGATGISCATFAVGATTSVALATTGAVCAPDLPLPSTSATTSSSSAPGSLLRALRRLTIGAASCHRCNVWLRRFQQTGLGRRFRRSRFRRSRVGIEVGRLQRRLRRPLGLASWDFCGVSAGRSSIYACRACNTGTALRAIRMPLRNQTCLDAVTRITIKHAERLAHRDTG